MVSVPLTAEPTPVLQFQAFLRLPMKALRRLIGEKRADRALHLRAAAAYAAVFGIFGVRILEPQRSEWVELQGQVGAPPDAALR